MIDHRGGYDGFYGAGTKLCNVAAIRISAAQGEFQRRHSVALILENTYFIYVQG